MVLLGLSLGSFINALVWRLHEQSKKSSKLKAQSSKLSIMHGRSMCPNCEHELAVSDLIPVVSWLALRGKCRYCPKPISWQYPLVELLTALLFTLSYLSWPHFQGRTLEMGEVVVFGLWLLSLTGLVALAVYDLRWMLLPNKIIFPLYGVATLMIIVQALQDSSAKPLASAAGGVLIGGGIFYILFQVSKGKWIGGGDVKLGFLLGALVGGPLSAAIMLFLASLIGSLFGGSLLLTHRISRGTRIPFGPFLIIAAIVVVLFGQQLSDWYIDTFISL